jgi:hypothetical protein
MMVGLYYVIQEMSIFPMSVANNFCDMSLPNYLDSKTVLIYRPHPVFVSRRYSIIQSIIHRYFFCSGIDILGGRLGDNRHPSVQVYYPFPGSSFKPSPPPPRLASLLILPFHFLLPFPVFRIRRILMFFGLPDPHYF